ncbi:MAG TPA: proline--tRNA ligase, partial [Armatimonadota bacterium]|nr:proline--tRNA ligase [Armatimonadota bacterium]
FRDEPRPRGGLVRAREFLMADAYSFDRDDAGLEAVYCRMFAAYTAIFRRIGVPAVPVEASGGAIGGTETKEFMLLTEAGEDTILRCPACGYAANLEVADFRLVVAEPAEPPRPSAAVDTPGAHTVEEVCRFLHTAPARLVKTLIVLADGRPVAALVRGDRELNEARLRAVLGAARLEMATPAQILAATGGPVGFSGPVGLALPLYADEELRGLVHFVAGANRADTHLVDVNWSDVAAPITWVRLRRPVAEDVCAGCGGPLAMEQGMELGHIFKLRYAVSEPLRLTFTDEDGRERLVTMGCYGLGVSRLLAAVAEACRDDRGLVWPAAVAPYAVYLMAANPHDDIQRALAERLYTELTRAGVDVLYDDRDERAGVKFTDADLLGLPLRVVVGKHAAADRVEVRGRAGGPVEAILVADLLPWIAKRSVHRSYSVNGYGIS